MCVSRHTFDEALFIFRGPGEPAKVYRRGLRLTVSLVRVHEAERWQLCLNSHTIWSTS
jgi:hypothetical protein